MNSHFNFSENFPLIQKDESELQVLADKYPWCSVAQLSLLTHYQRTDSEKFEQHATKAALFFNNTNWLNWQLHLLSKDAQFENGRTEENQTDVAPVMLNQHIEQSEFNGSPGNPSGEIIPEEPETHIEPEIQEENTEHSIFNDSPGTNITGEIMREEPETFEEPGIQEENQEQPIFNESTETNLNGEIMPEEPETYTEPEMQEENSEQPIFNDSPETNLTGEIMPEKSETFAEPEMQGEETESPTFNDSPETNLTGEIMHAKSETFAEPEMQKESEKPILNISAINSTNTQEEIMAFEPLHTTDYFASQGIRLTDEPVSHDKLGTQMKSFTEWLKSMKKINKQNLPAGDEQTDKNIQQIAEHSNEDAEVVTEAMADVLIKQNKNEKAIEVYEKLSLINPSKSAYFAAKIESLSTDR